MKRRIESDLLRTQRVADRPPRGFTLVELLVVIAIIGMLMALLIPAVQMAREAARRATCTNNQKNIGLAIMNFATARDRLPSGFSPHPLSTPGGTNSCLGWVPPLLPYLEQKPIYDRIQTDPDAANSPAIVGLTNLTLSILNCPSRTLPDTAVSPPAPLAYVVNAGMADNDGSDGEYSVYPPPPGTALDYQANGIFFDHYSTEYPGGMGPRITTDLTYITDHDGISNTILFSENLDAGDWIGLAAINPITSTSPLVVMPGQTHTQGIVWKMGQNITGYPDFAFFLNRDTATLSAATGYNYPKSDEISAKPSSSHPGIFLVTMVDGHTVQVSEDIEYRVYALLMAPWSSVAENKYPGTNTAVQFPPGLPWLDGTGNLAPVTEADLTK